MDFKKIFITVVLLIPVSPAFTQLSAVGYKSTAFAQFKASKTCFVKTGVPGFDNNAIAAMEANWKVTPYQVINQEEMATMISDKSLSFITVVLIGEQDYGYHYLALFNGGKKRMSSYQYEDMIAYASINRWGNETKLTNCGWRVSNMIESIIKAMDIVQKEDLSGNTLDIVKGLMEYYNKRAKDIPNRTLLVPTSGMGKEFKHEMVLGNYPYKVEICSYKKIEQAIIDKSTEYYYFQPGMTMNKNYMVVDPSNGDIMFFDFDNKGTEITEKNIKGMVEVIQGKQ